MYEAFLAVWIVIFIVGIICNGLLIWGLMPNRSRLWMVPWLVFQMTSVVIFSFGPIFVIYFSYDLAWNYRGERWKVFLALLPISAAVVGFYFWIHAKLVYDLPARPARPPAAARSARTARRKRTAVISATHVSPVTIYAREVYTNSIPAKPTENDNQFYAVAYNDYGPVLPSPPPIEDSNGKAPSSYNYPHLRVIPPTPVVEKNT